VQPPAVRKGTVGARPRGGGLPLQSLGLFRGIPTVRPRKRVHRRAADDGGGLGSVEKDFVEDLGVPLER
jgi:hypothetical protein